MEFIHIFRYQIMESEETIKKQSKAMKAKTDKQIIKY